MPRPLNGVDGLHMHTLCEQDLSPLLASGTISPRASATLPHI